MQRKGVKKDWGKKKGGKRTKEGKRTISLQKTPASRLKRAPFHIRTIIKR
jgi:hypothetical protein